MHRCHRQGRFVLSSNNWGNEQGTKTITITTTNKYFDTSFYFYFKLLLLLLLLDENMKVHGVHLTAGGRRRRRRRRCPSIHRCRDVKEYFIHEPVRRGQERSNLTTTTTHRHIFLFFFFFFLRNVPSFFCYFFLLSSLSCFCTSWSRIEQ